MGKKISNYKDENGNKGFHFHCEGCGSAHGVFIRGKGVPVWGFNGNEEKPTFTPSILVRWVSIPDKPEKDDKGKHILGPDGRIKGAKDERCHSFVTNGKIRYLNDCTHHLKGKTVQLLYF
jgi:hypothetical protein